MPGVLQNTGENIWGNKYPGGPPVAPITSFGDPTTFTAAANTQASDYDKIMANYDALAKSFSTDPLTAKPVSSIAPQTTPYEQSADVTSGLSKLSDLATTGGYSAADIADIRARDISPIRSIYANAQQNVEREKALEGGYSPNFDAVQAKMARDEANKISDVTTAANAGIAQNVATNKLSAAPSYASAAGSANAAKTAADQHNTDIINQINEANAGISEFNTGAALDAARTSRSGALGAVQGEASLYGTTPALARTFGDQVMQAGQLGQGQQNINNQRQRDIFSFAG